MIATALAVAVLTMTSPPADPTPVPPEETDLARTAFVGSVAESTGETLEFVACESHRSMSEPNSDYGEQPTVVTYCYGTVPSGVIFGALTHVTDDLNLIWTRYAVEGLPNLVQAIPVPPLVDGAATLPPEAGIPTTVPVLGTTVVDGAAETLPAEGTLPPESSLPQDTEVEGPAETLAPEAGLPTVPPQDTSG